MLALDDCRSLEPVQHHVDREQSIEEEIRVTGQGREGLGEPHSLGLVARRALSRIDVLAVHLGLRRWRARRRDFGRVGTKIGHQILDDLVSVVG